MRRYLVHCYDCDLEQSFKDRQAANYRAQSHARDGDPNISHRVEVYDDAPDQA